MLESFLVYKYGFPSNSRAMLAGPRTFPLARRVDAAKPALARRPHPRRPHRMRAGRAPVLCTRHRFDSAAPLGHR
ncbi:MAG: hypothetical protein ACN6P8_25670, partial [Achromobacter piechaudii]